MVEIGRLLRFLIRRLLFVIPVFFGVTILNWILMYSAGDPVRLMLLGRPNITQEVIENLRAYYHLDRPVWEQYLWWLWNFLHLDLGRSFYQNLPVNQLIGQWAWETVKLQLTSLAFAVILSIFIGIYSAKHPYSKADMIITSAALFGVSMPIFVLGIFAILIFSFYMFQWTHGAFYFPSFGAHAWASKYYPPHLYFMDELWHLAIPTLVLGFTMMALYVRLVRSGMRETLEQDYILAARASGLSERTVVYKHALRNAVIPLITYLGIAIAASLGGAPITETVFTWPGLGYFYVLSVTRLDFPVIMGINTLLTLFILAGNIIVDILYGVIDPRITLE